MRSAFAALMALGLLVPVLPGGQGARADFHDDAEQVPEPAVWRVTAVSLQESWAGEQKYLDVDFVDAERGFALLDGGVGAPTLLETVPDTDQGDWTPTAEWTGAWRVANTSYKLEAAQFIKPPGSNKTVGVAYGDSEETTGAVWKSDDGGRTWTDPEPRPVLAGSVRTINDFAFTTEDGSGVVGVGMDGRLGTEVARIIHSSDSGATWNDVVKGEGESDLNAVDFAPGLATDDGVGVAVGEEGAILVSDDGGVKWDEQRITVAGGSIEFADVGVAVYPDGGHVAVAVGSVPALGAFGTVGVLAYSTGDLTKWEVLGGAPGLPELRGVALTEEDGEVFGYVVGSETSRGQPGPVVFEMQRGDPTRWVPAPVATDLTTVQQDQILNRGLTSVSVDPSGRAAVAVGGRLMLERTPVADAEKFTDDQWWRCVPRRVTGEEDVDGAARDVVQDQEPENDEDPGLRVCPERGEDLTGAGDPEGFDPSFATTKCRLEGGSGQFPCLTTWKPLTGFDSKGQPRHVAVPEKVFVDPDVGGAGRRLVAVDTERIFLFDPDAPAQRGVPGFGEGFSGTSAFGGDTGVVSLAEAPETFPHQANFEKSRPAIPVKSIAYDETRDVVYLGSHTHNEDIDVPPVIAAVSLTGAFEPKTAATVPPYVDEQSPGRLNASIVTLAFDNRYGMLYVLSQTDRDRPFATGGLWTSETVTPTLHAYATGVDSAGEPSGDLERRWSLPLEGQNCRTTRFQGAKEQVLAIAPTGDALSFVCPGFSGPHFGNPNFEPHRVMTVRLRLGSGEHPADLDARDPSDVAVRAEPVAGLAVRSGEATPVLAAEARNVLVWNQRSHGASLWDFDSGGWIGAVTRKEIAGATGLSLGADHPRRGRLYMTCLKCVDFNPSDDDSSQESAMLVVDSLNVPAGKPAGVSEQVRLPSGENFPAPLEEGHWLAAIPPRHSGNLPRVAVRANGGAALHVFEDRVAPEGLQVRPDPDDDTNPDVPESEANDVRRIGRARSHGARMWWTGLGTSTTPTCQYLVGATGAQRDPCGSPTLSYDWLTGRDSRGVGVVGDGVLGFGRHTGAVPGFPADGKRELRLGEVQKAELEVNTSGHRSDGKATAFFYGGGPADDSRGNTGEDLKRRRGRDPHRYIDTELAQFCNLFGVEAGDGTLPATPGMREQFRRECAGAPDDPDTEEDESRGFWDDFQDVHEGQPDDPDTDDDESTPGFDGQFGPYEAAFAEFVDRGQREIDGERQEQGGCAAEDRNGDGKIDEKDNNGFFEQADDPETPEDESDCWEEFDRHDPRSDERTPERLRDRRSVEERAELTYASDCLEPAGRDERSAGSHANCEVGEFGSTAARAELDGFSLTPDSDLAGGPVSIGATGSDTRVFRDRKLGMVTEAVAWATDVEVEIPEGSLQIGEVRSEARAWAHGRDDTAGSEYDVTFTHVLIAGPDGQERFSCGASDERLETPSTDPNDLPDENDLPDQNDLRDQNDIPDRDDVDPGEGRPEECDPHQVADVISTLLGGKVQATTSARDTDPDSVGSDGGAQALVRRDQVDVLSDEVINLIQGQHELPALQLTIYNDGLRPNRLKVDLAAVYLESKYFIGERRVEVPPAPGTLEVQLSDLAGAPLPGGGFVVARDDDGDGQVSSGDTSVRECVTDASGRCGFDGLKAGSFVVEQRSAPPGFLPEAAPRSVFVGEGGFESVEFVNGPDGAGVVVELVDPSGNALAGGEFALVPDLDGDGSVEPSDAVAGACVTGDAGTCRFDRVNPGPWVLHQTAAPGGYKAAGDIAFVLQQAGQVAHIRVVNGPAVAGATVRIVEIIDGAPTSNSRGGDAPWWALLPKGLAALLTRGWVQALLFGLTGMLFGAPAYLAHRRRELGLATRRR